MADQDEHYERSWVLHHILDRIVGSREMVHIRRRLKLTEEYLDISSETNKVAKFYTGSRAEGFNMPGSDTDMMGICSKLMVMCPNQDTDSLSDNRDMTIFIMKNADCRPCYVNLELFQRGRCCNPMIRKSVVPVRDLHFISSEIYEELYQAEFSAALNVNLEIHGPAASIKNVHSNIHVGLDIDFVSSFPCASWPPVANEWLRRPRLFGWPDKTLIHNISQSGCHVVPVGDKTSADTFLQWRISFATAERKLIHSLSHEQFLVYGLLKYFLKQIFGILKKYYRGCRYSFVLHHENSCIICSRKYTLFLLEEQNTFLCFVHCIHILITWIDAGHCPNYFIIGNNILYGKVLGENQQKLLRFLRDIYDMKWMCFFVGTSLQPSIGVRIARVLNGEWESILLSPKYIEYECDMEIFKSLGLMYDSSAQCSRSLALLCKSNSDMDEFIAYRHTVTSLSYKGMETFGKHIAARGNKEKYMYLRKCRNFLMPHASVNTSPGQLVLATYYYHTGNYMKALEICGNMISSFKLYGYGSSKDKDRYTHLYCGRGYPLLKKYQEVIVSEIIFTRKVAEFCPSQLHEELIKCIIDIVIPPHPYAVFLFFLCYHELGDPKRRDTALIHLRAVKYDEIQGGAIQWIVHNLLGICYETIGDIRRAINEYKGSLSGGKVLQQQNPAKEKIERLQHFK